jgi:Phage integrase family
MLLGGLIAGGVRSPDGSKWNAKLVGNLFWEVIPKYVPLLPLVEQLVREGAGNPEIAERLNAAGHRRRGGILWNPEAVCDLFGTARMRHPERFAVALVKLTRLHDKWVNRLISKLAKEAGLSIVVRPHGLRHCGVTRALDLTNGDIRKAQKFARHADPKTTMRYDDDRTDVAGEVADLIGDDF